MFWKLCLQIHSLCKSCTTLFAYVSLDFFPMKFFLLACVAICVFRLLPYANPAPHSLQLNGFSSLCILVFGGNTAPHSLQKKFFSSPVCVAICIFRWLPFAPQSLQKKVFLLLWFVFPYMSSDHFPLQILHHTLSMCLFRWPLQGNTGPHSLSKKVCVATLQMTSLCKSCTTLYAYVS